MGYDSIGSVVVITNNNNKYGTYCMGLGTSVNFLQSYNLICGIIC